MGMVVIIVRMGVGVGVVIDCSITRTTWMDLESAKRGIGRIVVVVHSEWVIIFINWSNEYDYY